MEQIYNIGYSPINNNNINIQRLIKYNKKIMIKGKRYIINTNNNNNNKNKNKNTIN